MFERGGRKAPWNDAYIYPTEPSMDAQSPAGLNGPSGFDAPNAAGSFGVALWSAHAANAFAFGESWRPALTGKQSESPVAATPGHGGGTFGDAGGAPSSFAARPFAPAPAAGGNAVSDPGRFGVNLTQAAVSAATPAVSDAATGSPTVRMSAASFSQSAPSPSGATLSAPQLLDFTHQGAVALGNGFSWSLPSFLYASYGPATQSASSDGFGVSASFSVAGGIKGGLTYTPASITPNFPLEMNPEVLDYVQQGQTFSVKPTLISTDGAGFSLNLPTATASLSFGLTASAGVSLEFPSVTIGWSIFSHTFDGPTISKTVSGGKIYTLPNNLTENFPGGYASVSQINGSTAQSTLASQSGTTLANVSETFYTAPFVSLHFDAIAAIAQYVPELKELNGSENFGVGSASWSLLSLPFNASLKLADKVTTSEVGFTTDLQETIRGVTSDLGTYAIGHEWDLMAPSYSGPGYGVIALVQDYALTLNVQSVLSLFGSFDLTLNGPQGSASIFGEGFSVGPIFSLPIIAESGDIADLSTTNTQVTLTSSQRELIFYGTSASSVMVTASQQTSFDLAASGALLTINSGVYISPSASAATPTIGVQATLGADGVYNYGSVYAQAGAGSVGIDLLKGGKLVNKGDINANHGGGHYRGKVRYGVEIGGKYSTIINTGTIGADFTGVAALGANVDFTLFLYNEAGAAISGSQYGVNSATALIDLHNDGIVSSSGVAVQGGGAGVFVYNHASGTITGSGLGSVIGGTGQGFIDNEGQIGTGAGGPGQYGVRLAQGNVFNFGTIAGSSVGVKVGSPNIDTSSVYNAGLIEASGGYAVEMYGKTNTLTIKPGAQFIGQVKASASATSNVIDLLAGSGTGTISTVAGSYENFDRINIASYASWLVQVDPTGFDRFTLSGLSSLDLISFRGTGFQYGDHVSLNSSTGLLSLLAPSGSTLATATLAPGLSGARFNVFGTPSSTYIREFTGPHFSNVIGRTIYGSEVSLPSQIINSNSYFGPTSSGNGVTVAQNEGVEYQPAAYPSRKFGIDLQAVTVASTVVTNGVTSVTNAVQPSVLYNHGFVTGYQEGVLLQTDGTIYNENQIKSEKITYKYNFGIKSAYPSPFGDGILQAAGSTYAKIVNYGDNPSAGQAGFIYGQNGIVLTAAAIVENQTSDDTIYGAGDGIISTLNTTIQNAGSITGSAAIGVVLGHDSAVFNTNTGVITGGVDGVSATGTAVAVTNAGLIKGPIGVSLANGGAVSNTYALVGGTPVWGTITGAKYAVVIGGGAGNVTNGYGTVGGGASPASIGGVLLSAGGNIVNGNYGVINGGGAYGVNLGTAAAATISNSGSISAIRAARGDHIGNKASGVIRSVTGIGGALTSPLSIVNAGVIGAGAASLGVNTSIATYLNNSGTIENGIRFAGGGTIVDSGEIRGASSTASAIAFGAAAATLVAEAGVYFYGNVVGVATDTLELGAANYSGYLHGLGSQITGFAKTMVDAGAYWTLGGTNSLAGKWTVAGTLAQLANSSLVVTGSVAVTGRVQGASSGSYGTTDGLSVASGVLNNSGVIVGGNGSGFSNGANGVDVTGGLVLNSGIIAGGNDFNGEFSPGYGGFGVYLGGGALVNTGQINSGASQAGATQLPVGVYVGGNATLTNSGTISGASGADAVQFRDSSGKLVLRPGAVFNGVVAGAGGGLDLSFGVHGMLSGLGTEFTDFAQVTEDVGSSWTLTGANTISSAITLGSGATLTLAGSLTNSGGGPAVYLDGGVFVNAGTLASSAIQFGPAASTFGITPTASFTGAVTAPSGAGDTLLLTGSTGTLTGLGTKFTNFGTLAVASGGVWSMAATPAFNGALIDSGWFVVTGGTQTIAGKIAGTGVLRVSGNSVLDLAGSGSIAQNVGGTGTIEVQGTISLATNSFSPGALEIVAGGTLAGVGVISAPIIDNGMLNAFGGALTVKGSVSGSGTLNAAPGATLALAGGGNFGGTIAGSGTIDFNAPFTLTSGAILRANDIVETANLTLGPGESFSITAGHIFDIETSTSAPLTLASASSSTISNAGTLSASGPGSATVQPRIINSSVIINNGGTLTLAGPVTSSGTISANAGLLAIQQAVSGSGTMTVGATGTLSLAAAVAPTQTVDLTHSGLLDLGAPLSFQGSIADFSSSAGIDLLATAVTSDSYASNFLTLFNGSKVVGKLHFIGTYTLSSFQVGSDNHNGTLIGSHS